MSFAVQYAARARQDLRNIYAYIAYDLLAPEAAERQARRIMKEIEALHEMPMRYRLYDEEPWRSQGIRFFPVDKYLIFYLPDETQNTVNIVRIIYGGRDMQKQLEEAAIGCEHPQPLQTSAQPSEDRP